MANLSEPLLEVKELNAYYGPIKIIRGLDLKAERGKVTALLGTNGAGKSTLLNCITGIHASYDGSIKFNGKEISSLDPWDRAKFISLIPQDKSLFQKMTVEDNLSMASSDVSKERLNELQDLIYNLFPALEDRKKQMAYSLSGGEQSMLSISMGIISDPDLLILDEPLLGLAPKLIDDVVDALFKLKERVSMLISFQDIKMLKIADYGFILEDGKIALESSREKLEESGKVKEIYLGM